MDRFLLISWLAGCVGHTDKRAQIKRAWERAGPSWRSQQLLWFLKGSCVKSKHQVWSWPGAAHLTLGRNNHPHTSSHQHTSVTCSLLSPWHRNPLCVSVHLCFMRLSANVQIKWIEMKWNVFLSRAAKLLHLDARCSRSAFSHHLMRSADVSHIIKSPLSCSLSHFSSVPTRKRKSFPQSHFTGKRQKWSE